MWDKLTNNVLEVKLMVHESRVDDTVETADKHGFVLKESYESHYNRMLIFKSKICDYINFKPTN